MKSIVFMMISLLSFSASANKVAVEVFTTATQLVVLNGIKAQVCHLDELSQITQKLNQHQDSLARVKQSAHEEREHLISFYRCQGQAQAYELTSLPAIVINKAYVIYGVHSLDKALFLFRRYQEVHHV
ncbi:DUF1525 domain-containing protein [Legionella drancourtii]|uniref:DUF1525 domain-containing protein n=1 Tax=Legionella drancourtii TaxID=168933 RepID=UPI00058EF17C|nr:DUF1525 domain-containing protein [Legionella drancourtii]